MLSCGWPRGPLVDHACGRPRGLHGFSIRRQIGRLCPAAVRLETSSVKQYNIKPWKQQLKEIRQKVTDEHLSGGLVYLSAGELKLRNGTDVHYKFRPNSNYYYLSGFSEPGASCILDTDTGDFALLVPMVPEDMAIWMGDLRPIEELAEEVGADSCGYTSDLASILRERYAGRMVHTLPECAQDLNDMAVEIRTDTVARTLDRCRCRKTDSEVACLQYANEVSGRAHMAMWRACRPGMREYELEAVFVSSTMAAGLIHTGYPPIVAGGRNAATLHYERNDALVGADDMVLVDAGAEFRCYTADISRTFPASGTFTPDQRRVYDATLLMQRQALGMMGPGAHWRELDRTVRTTMLEFLQDFGCIRPGADMLDLLALQVDRLFLPHGLGHFLGLDVHDPSDGSRPVPDVLQPGHVVTCEPGIYFSPNLMRRAAANPEQAAFLDMDRIQALYPLGGIRIEDNVAITAKGHHNLTVEAGVPSHADDIQALIAA